MSRVKKMVTGALLSVLMLGATSSPALAINDALVPAENCALAHSNPFHTTEAVGHPAASALLATGQFEKLPVSANNPGVSTGAMGGELSAAQEHCI